MLTTIHKDDVVAVERRSQQSDTGRELVQKPKAIVEYNKYMGGVDRADQFLSYYRFSHRTVKWWRRAFFFLLDMAVVNSYVLYTFNNPNSKARLNHEQFRIQLAKELLTSDVAETAIMSANPCGSIFRPHDPSARLRERHFPTTIGKNSAGKSLQQECCVCSNKGGRKKKTTTYKCRQCNSPMCIVPCFELHHTRKDPLRHLH